jgi:chemotaxis protein MotA
MDFATLIGLISGTAVVLLAIFLGGDFMTFVNVPSLLIVVGGAVAATILRFTLADVFVALRTGCRIAFSQEKSEPQALIERMTELSGIARREGPLGLEQADIPSPFLKKGIQFLVDGIEAKTIEHALNRDRERYIESLQEGEKVFRSLGEAAPAFGMIGTLIGLVQMLSTMDDPAKIGPAMAIALLTTLYGSLIAALIANPIADKLASKAQVEDVNMLLMVEGVSHIHNKVHPDLMIEFLNAYLPASKRALAEEVPA